MEEEMAVDSVVEHVQRPTEAWVEGMISDEAPVDIEVGTTMAYPQFVPMQYPYSEERFYVRACYPEYYEKMKYLFRFKTGITITGTPGMYEGTMSIDDVS